jgi:hypothetical protein
MTFQIIPREDIPAMQAKGWRVVSYLERSPHAYWAVLMERTEP